MNELETKRQKYQKWAKFLGFGAFLVALGPIYILMLQGIAALVALGIAAAVAFVVINLLPAFGVLVANWRLKALKAVASANPIETLENQYEQKMTTLAATLENITKSFAVLQNLHTQIKAHNEKFPNRPSQHLDKFQKLKALVKLRGDKYKLAKANLAKFSELIDEKRSDWEIAKTMAEASELAKVGEDFQSKLLQDTAVNTVNTELNMAFAELETSLLDADDTVTTVTVLDAVEVATVNKGRVAQLPEKTGALPLDLGFNIDDIEADFAMPVRRGNKSGALPE